MSLDQETIERQQTQLMAHRRRLAYQLRRQASLGAAYTPPDIALDIEDAQAAIHTLKAALRAADVTVADDPSDDISTPASVVPALTPLDQRNRKRMLQKVRDFWVKGVLEKSIHHEAVIALELEERPDAVVHPWEVVVQQDHGARRLPLGTSIAEVFDDGGGELLILGAAGSGKTMLLLGLTRELLNRADQEISHPIPVVFNLSSWAEKRPLLVTWLVDELNNHYDVPRKVGKVWVEGDALLLLLDGLDEVRPEHRSACVKTINAYRQEHGLVPLAVCSRITDYDLLTEKLRLQGWSVVQRRPDRDAR